MAVTINENIQLREVAEGLWFERVYTISGTVGEAAARPPQRDRLGRQ